MLSGAARPRCSLIAPSAIPPTRVPTISMSTSRWQQCRWCAAIWPAAASCSASIPSRATLDLVFITGACGLGENVVHGAVDPDEFRVHKPTYRQGIRSVLRRTLGDKQIRMVCAPSRARAGS
jgi:Pyruvate phosphate dikinase, AMP/ATP-binding domain